MKTFQAFLLVPALLASLTFSASTVRAADAAEVGKPAPAFTLKGGDGKEHSLADAKGKIVVLEWTNPGCPFVKKFYEPGEMQKLQKELTGKDVVWYRVNSGHPGAQGAMTVDETALYDKANNVAATATLIDSDGKTGKAYGARTTPHLFVIDKEGTLVYAGGIDDKATVKSEDIAGANNYVKAAVEELIAGKPVTTKTSKPYGCSVKYAK